jgi:hypothetical protein
MALHVDHSPGQTGQIAAAGYQFTKKIAAFGTRAPMIEGNISRMILHHSLRPSGAPITVFPWK